MIMRLRVLLLVAAMVVATSSRAARGFLSTDAGMAGEKLAEIYCGTCHMVPPPDILDRYTWNREVLPWMASLLGVYEGYYGSNKLTAARQSGAAWSKAPLHPEQFNAIAAYYQLRAPSSLYSTNTQNELHPATSGFRMVRRSLNRVAPPATTLVKIDEGHGSHFAGFEVPARLVYRDPVAGIETLIHEGVIPVALCDTEDGIYYADIGSVVPDFRKIGRIYFAPRSGDVFGAPELVADGFPRLAHLTRGDLNADGIADLVVCAFGFFTGEVAWLEGLPGGGFRKHLIFERAGAVKAEIRDLNDDGYPDLIVMLAQALECIYFLYNDGRGGFSGEPVISRHPAFGFTDFEVADLDGDGASEIITVNGDFDYDGSVRPYQGIRVFQMTNGVTEVFFHSLPGSYHVEVEDFDQDGDRDIVAVSFTPGLGLTRTPRTLYLENIGAFSFRSWELPHTDDGRWFIADAGDDDGDGDADLLLGALINAPGSATPSNDHSRSSFGILAFETILFENVFSDGVEQRVDWRKRQIAKGQAVPRFFQVPVP
jgi:hypothetical protein